MGGFDTEKAFTTTGMNPDEYNVIFAIAIGKIGDASSLPDNVREGETPNNRKPMEEVVFEGLVE